MEYREIPLDLIERDPEQPRKHFSNESLQELADSYTIAGVIQPITVRKAAGKYVLVAGERRWRAAGIAALETIPAIVKQFEDESHEALVRLIENVQRDDLNPMEIARYVKFLSEEHHLKQQEIALALGNHGDRSSVSHYLRLLSLHNRVQQMLDSGDLSFGHGKVLAAVPEDEQITLADLVVDKELSVRQLEHEVKRLRNAGQGRVIGSEDGFVERLETNLSDSTGYPVKIKHSKAKKAGSVVIKYTDLDQLDGILRLLGYDENR